MTIRYQCADCGSVLKIKDALAGTNGKCPKCQTAFVVPNPEKVSERSATANSSGDQASSRAGDDEEFDPVAFLMDSTDPGAKASAGLASKPSEPQQPAKDRHGRRHIVAPPPGPMASGSSPAALAAAAGMGASANARELLTKAAEESHVRASIPPDMLNKPKLDFSTVKYQLKQSLAWICGGLVLIISLYAGVWYMLYKPLPLPELAPVTGTVTINGEPAKNIVVKLTPVEILGKSTSGKDIRLSTASGVTDEQGYFTVNYFAGVEGAPVGRVRVSLDVINAADYLKIPAQYTKPTSNDTREVKRTGNNHFLIELTTQ